MRMLDRKRDFGRVYGKHELGATYEQDGVLFDSDGRQIEKPKGRPRKIAKAKHDIPVAGV